MHLRIIVDIKMLSPEYVPFKILVVDFVPSEVEELRVRRNEVEAYERQEENNARESTFHRRSVCHKSVDLLSFDGVVFC